MCTTRFYDSGNFLYKFIMGSFIINDYINSATFLLQENHHSCFCAILYPSTTCTLREFRAVKERMEMNCPYGNSFMLLYCIYLLKYYTFLQDKCKPAKN